MNEVIPYIETYFSEKKLPTDIIHPLLYLNYLSDDLNYEAQQQFFILSQHYFYKAKEFFEIVKWYVTEKMTNSKKA